MTWYHDNLHYARVFFTISTPLSVILQFVFRPVLFLWLASSLFMIYTAMEAWSHNQDVGCRALDNVTTYAMLFWRAFILTLLLSDIFLHLVHPNRFSPSAKNGWALAKNAPWNYSQWQGRWSVSITNSSNYFSIEAEARRDFVCHYSWYSRHSCLEFGSAERNNSLFHWQQRTSKN